MNYMKCDKCGWKSPVENLIVKEQMEGENKLRFIQCGKCGEKFIVSVFTPEIQQGLSVLESKRKELRCLRQKKVREKTFRKKYSEYENLQKKMKQMMEVAKKNYLSGEGASGQEETQTAHSLGVCDGISIGESAEDPGADGGPAETVPGSHSAENSV